MNCSTENNKAVVASFRLDREASSPLDLVMLFSTASFNHDVYTNQQTAFDLLEQHGIPFETVDGSDVSLKAMRNQLWSLVVNDDDDNQDRDAYPQFFLRDEKGKLTYFGDIGVLQMAATHWSLWKRLVKEKDGSANKRTTRQQELVKKEFRPLTPKIKDPKKKAILSLSSPPSHRAVKKATSMPSKKLTTNKSSSMRDLSAHERSTITNKEIIVPYYEEHRNKEINWSVAAHLDKARASTARLDALMARAAALREQTILKGTEEDSSSPSLSSRSFVYHTDLSLSTKNKTNNNNKSIMNTSTSSSSISTTGHSEETGDSPAHNPIENDSKEAHRSISPSKADTNEMDQPSDFIKDVQSFLETEDRNVNTVVPLKVEEMTRKILPDESASLCEANDHKEEAENVQPILKKDSQDTTPRIKKEPNTSEVKVDSVDLHESDQEEKTADEEVVPCAQDHHPSFGNRWIHLAECEKEEGVMDNEPANKQLEEEDKDEHELSHESNEIVMNVDESGNHEDIESSDEEAISDNSAKPPAEPGVVADLSGNEEEEVEYSEHTVESDHIALEEDIEEVEISESESDQEVLRDQALQLDTGACESNVPELNETLDQSVEEILEEIDDEFNSDIDFGKMGDFHGSYKLLTKDVTETTEMESFSQFADSMGSFGADVISKEDVHCLSPDAEACPQAVANIELDESPVSGEDQEDLESKILVLIATQTTDREVPYDQQNALCTLEAYGVSHFTMDGSDPVHREVRNELFKLSQQTGPEYTYPQFFRLRGDDVTFLGGMADLDNAIETQRLGEWLTASECP